MSRNGRSPSDIFLLGNRRLTNDLDLAFSRRQTANLTDLSIRLYLRFFKRSNLCGMVYSRKWVQKWQKFIQGLQR